MHAHDPKKGESFYTRPFHLDLVSSKSLFRSCLGLYLFLGIGSSIDTRFRYSSHAVLDFAIVSTKQL